MLLMSILLTLIQNGLSTLFDTTATVTDHYGKPPIFYVYKNVPPHLLPVSAPYTSAHDRQELYGARPFIYQNKPSYVPVIHPVYTIKSSLPPSASYQLEQQKRNYLNQLEYLNRHQTPVYTNNEHFGPSQPDYGFQPLIKPSIPITSSNSGGYNPPPQQAHPYFNHGISSKLQTVTPQPYGYVRSYVDLLKQRQKQHFANPDPDLDVRDYGRIQSYNNGDDVSSSVGSDDDGGEEVDVSVNDGGGSSSSTESDNNSVQQHENIEHSGEVGYFKQREHEIGNQKFSGNKKSSKNQVGSAETYNQDDQPKLYKVTEDFEDPGESDIEPSSGDISNEEPNYNSYRNSDDSYEQDELDAAEDEDEEESKQHPRISQPIKTYSQVRHVETKNQKPLKRPVYEPNLRERLSQEKRHLVYKEEGYEDKDYDHSEQEKESEKIEEKGVKGGKRKRQRRLRKKQQQQQPKPRNKRDIESYPELPEPSAIQAVGRPFRGSKKYGAQNNNLTGMALINHINELIENTTLYLPDDDSKVQDQVHSGSEVRKPFVSVFKPASPEEIVDRYLKDPSPVRRPVKSIYSTKPPIECDEDDIDLDEEGFDGTKKKRGGNLGEKLDCLKNKHFGIDPFHSSFFKGELGKTGTLSNKKKLEADKRHSANISKTVYDDVMNIIKSSQSSIVSTTPKIQRSTEKPRFQSLPIRRPQTSYLEDTSSEENLYSPSLHRPTSIPISSPPNYIDKEKRKTQFSIFDINQFYPKPTIDPPLPKAAPYKYYTTSTSPTPTYTFTSEPTLVSPSQIPFRSVHHPHHKHPTNPARHPNLILHKQPEQSLVQATQIKSHLHTNVLRPVFRPYQGGPIPGKRIVVHRVQY